MMVQNGVHKRSWLGYKSHLKIRYCSEYIMFEVYLDLSYHAWPWWYHDGFDVVLAKVGVCMILCLHLLWLL